MQNCIFARWLLLKFISGDIYQSNFLRLTSRKFEKHVCVRHRMHESKLIFAILKPLCNSLCKQFRACRIILQEINGNFLSPGNERRRSSALSLSGDESDNSNDDDSASSYEDESESDLTNTPGRSSVISQNGVDGVDAKRPKWKSKLRRRRKKKVGKKKKWPKFPRKPDSMLNQDEIEGRRKQLEKYLDAVLQSSECRNHHEAVRKK